MREPSSLLEQRAVSRLRESINGGFKTRGCHRRGHGLGRAIALARPGRRADRAARSRRGRAGDAGRCRPSGRRRDLDLPAISPTPTASSRSSARFARSSPVDILVNNVGGSMRGEAVRFADSDLQLVRSYDRPQPAPDGLVQPPGDRRHEGAGWGRIVNITSEAAFRGSERMWDYGAAKGGIVTFTRSLAIEVGRFGVTVNAVGPGLTRTAAYDALSPEIRDASMKGIPTGHPGEPEDIAHAVSFFASEGARQVNGQTLLVNGGTWLREGAEQTELLRDESRYDLSADRAERRSRSAHNYARAIEQIGYDHLLMYDHVVGAVHEGREPKRWGPIPIAIRFTIRWSPSGYLAGITKRIELHTGVLDPAAAPDRARRQAGDRCRPASRRPAAARRRQRLEPCRISGARRGFSYARQETR